MAPGGFNGSGFTSTAREVSTLVAEKAAETWTSKEATMAKAVEEVVVMKVATDKAMMMKAALNKATTEKVVVDKTAATKGNQHHAHNFSCSCDVGQQMLVGLRSHHDWQRRQVLLQLLESLICFFSLDKGFRLLQQPEERESPLCQSRDKLVERGQASRELLGILDAGWQQHHFNRLGLL
jgi:hypothetical protein